MLTKHVSTTIDTTKDERVVCPKCNALVIKNDLVITDKGVVCVKCYNQSTGV